MIATAAAPARSKSRIALYALQVVLGLFMAIASGAPKLFGEASAVHMFAVIGAGDWLRYFVGVCEVAGGIGLLIPLVAGLAAALFVPLMIGATVVQLTVIHEFWYTPLIIGALMAVIAWSRRTEIPALLRR